MTDSAENVTGPWRYERIDGPGHWMQLEAPDAINQLLLTSSPGKGLARLTENQGGRTELGHRSPARTRKPNEPSRSDSATWRLSRVGINPSA